MLSILDNLNLLSVGLSITATVILGFIVFFNDKKNETNRTFLFFSLVSVAWGFINYISYTLTNETLALWAVRGVMFFATWQAFLLFKFFYIFPSKEFVFSKLYKKFLIPMVVIVSLVTLSPIFFVKVINFVPGAPPIVEKGPGLILFAFLSISFVLAGLYSLIKKIVIFKKGERAALLYILMGTSLTFALIIIFNFIFPIIFVNIDFLPFSALFTFPFILFSSYAIIKHNLMNIKVISTEILVFGISVAILFEVITAEDLITMLYKSSLFLLVLSVGILLIRSVRNEVQAREKVAKLAESLEKANLRLQELDRQKTEFLSIASHQLRTPMSIIKGYIELIQDGAYGKITKETFKILADMDETNERLVKLIDEFLDISRIEQGRTKFIFERKDMNELINSVTKELTQRAKDKKLGIEWKPGKGKEEIVMDEEKVRHVVFNFIDNAIKYSMTGIIKVSLEREKNGMNVRVKDNGIGFDKVDEANFFQKFYRGRNVKTTNVGGTGLGIYVTKQFIEKHGGEVWAKSEGLGKGGEFGFWIPNNEQKLKEQEEDALQQAQDIEKAAKAKLATGEQKAEEKK